MSTENKSGEKYLRKVVGLRDGKADVYTVIEIFDVRCPALQHAIKKLLCAGIRGENSCLNDLEEARDAVTRAIELQKDREGITQQSQALVAGVLLQKNANGAFGIHPMQFGDKKGVTER